MSHVPIKKASLSFVCNTFPSILCDSVCMYRLQKKREEEQKEEVKVFQDISLPAL